MDPVAPDVVPEFEIGRPHRNGQRLGFCAPGNDTAIIITQNQYWFATQVGTKYCLATGIERVHIHQRKHHIAPFGLKT